MDPSIAYVFTDPGLLAFPLDLSSDSLEGGLSVELTRDPTNKTHTEILWVDIVGFDPSDILIADLVERRYVHGNSHANRCDSNREDEFDVHFGS